MIAIISLFIGIILGFITLDVHNPVWRFIFACLAAGFLCNYALSIHS